MVEHNENKKMSLSLRGFGLSSLGKVRFFWLAERLAPFLKYILCVLLVSSGPLTFIALVYCTAVMKRIVPNMSDSQRWKCLSVFSDSNPTTLRHGDYQMF